MHANAWTCSPLKSQRNMLPVPLWTHPFRLLSGDSWVSLPARTRSGFIIITSAHSPRKDWHAGTRTDDVHECLNWRPSAYLLRQPRINENAALLLGYLSAGSFADQCAVLTATVTCLSSLVLQDLAKGDAARLPLLTHVLLAVHHPKRWARCFPRSPWGYQGTSPLQYLPIGSGWWGPTAAAAQLLQALPWPFPNFLLALGTDFPFHGVACACPLGTLSLVTVLLP